MNISEINLTPAELLAILEHKRTMRRSHGQEVTVEAAIEHFILHFRADWMKDKHRRDNEEQLREIERHKYFRSLSEGRDIGRNQAAAEWCSKYAHIWRAERESLERNGFLQISLVIKDPRGFHVRPSSTMAHLVSQYDCEVYMHRAGMEYGNLVLQGRNYLNVKSVLGLLTLGAVQGDTLEFIATGSDASRVLEAISNLVSGSFDAQSIEGVPGMDSVGGG